MSRQTLDIIPYETAGTLDGLFLQRVNRTPLSVAYRYYQKSNKIWKEINWSEMASHVAMWQNALDRESLETGDRVAIMAHNCPSWVMLDQAALGMGLVTVPLYCDDRPGNIAYILKDSNVKLILIENLEQWNNMKPVYDQLNGLNRVLVIESGGGNFNDHRIKTVEEWLPEQTCDLRERNGDPDQLATIVYTSGTTGKPKGVKLSHRNILWNAASGLLSVPIYVEDIFLSFLPLSHTFERTIGYYLPIMAGATVAYARSIPSLGEDLITISPTILIAVPRIFERVYTNIKFQLDEKSTLARKLFNLTIRIGKDRFEYLQKRGTWHASLILWTLLDRLVASKIRARMGGRIRVAICGGAALSSRVGSMFLYLGVPLLQGYGLTETSPVISVNLLENNDPESVGLMLNGVQAKIGWDDELLVKSPGVMLGYWNNADATSQMIDEKGWLHTGDKVRIESGKIYITGRLKEIIVMANGEKIPPTDIEMAIAMDSIFEQEIVIGDGYPYLSALVILNNDLWVKLAEELGLDPFAPESLKNKSLEETLKDHIAKQMCNFPGYAQIRQIAVLKTKWTVENGLLTPTLKLRRKRILDRFSDVVADLYAGH